MGVPYFELTAKMSYNSVTQLQTNKCIILLFCFLSDEWSGIKEKRRF